jgi:hypothetical protein
VPDISKPDDQSGPSSGPQFGPPPGTPPTGGWAAPPGAPAGGYGGPPPAYGPAPGGYGAPPGYGGPPGYGTPPGYGPYGAPPPPAPGRPTNNSALASLILGVATFAVAGFGCFPVTAILAVVFGHKGRREIEESGGWQDGAGMATAGIVLGWVGIGLTVFGIAILVVVLVVAAGTDSSSLQLMANLAT